MDDNLSDTQLRMHLTMEEYNAAHHGVAAYRLSAPHFSAVFQRLEQYTQSLPTSDRRYGYGFDQFSVRQTTISVSCRLVPALWCSQWYQITRGIAKSPHSAANDAARKLRGLLAVNIALHYPQHLLKIKRKQCYIWVPNNLLTNTKVFACVSPPPGNTRSPVPRGEEARLVQSLKALSSTRSGKEGKIRQSLLNISVVGLENL